MFARADGKERRENAELGGEMRKVRAKGICLKKEGLPIGQLVGNSNSGKDIMESGKILARTLQYQEEEKKYHQNVSIHRVMPSSIV